MSKYYSIVDDFPVKGVKFLDFQKSFDSPEVFNELIEMFINKIKQIDKRIDYIACLDARGFIYGSVIANKLGIPFFIVRKKGKLPPPYIASEEYSKEYGTGDILTMSPIKNKNILIIDDVLATGGTLNATYDLIHKSESIVIGAIVIKAIEGIKRDVKCNVMTLL